MKVRLGQWVETGETIAVIHYNNSNALDEVSGSLQRAISIQPTAPQIQPLILAQISPEADEKA